MYEIKRTQSEIDELLNLCDGTENREDVSCNEATYAEAVKNAVETFNYQGLSFYP